MPKRAKQLPLVIARGFEVMINKLPGDVLVHPDQAEEALRRYRLRTDNHLTSAFSELVVELMACMDTTRLKEKDVVNMIVQMKEELE